VLVGGVLAGLVAFVCGEPGVRGIIPSMVTYTNCIQVRYHLGFPMMSRAAFGMYGSYFVIMLKIFVNFIL